MRKPLANSAQRANKKTVRKNTPNQNSKARNVVVGNKAKSGVGNMTRLSRVFFEQKAKTNQERTQIQANKLTLAPILRAIKPVQPAVRGKPFGERVFCPTGCESISVLSEPIDGGVKLSIKYPSVEIAKAAKRGISILRSDLKGKGVLLQALPKKQKQAWKKTAMDVANHSSLSTLVLKFRSMRGEGEASLPPELAGRIFSSYPDFTSRLTQEDIVEYWKFFMMHKFNKSTNTPLQLKDVHKKLKERDYVSKSNTKNFQHKFPYLLMQKYAAQIAKMANEIRLKTTNEVNVATKRNERLRAERIIPPKIVMLTYRGQTAFYIEDKSGSRAYFPVHSDLTKALAYYRNLKTVTEFFQKVDNFTTTYGPNDGNTTSIDLNQNQYMFQRKNRKTKNTKWEDAKKKTMRTRWSGDFNDNSHPAFFTLFTEANLDKHKQSKTIYLVQLVSKDKQIEGIENAQRQRIQKARAEIHDEKFKEAMREHHARQTHQVFTREKGNSSSKFYGRLVTGMIAKVQNEDDVERILVGEGIDKFSMRNGNKNLRMTFQDTPESGGNNVKKLSSSGAGREKVFTQFLTHLKYSQIAPIDVNAEDHMQVTDLENMLTGTNRFNPGRALCWLKSFVFDPKKQIIFGDRNTKIEDRRKEMREFATRLKLTSC